MYESKLVYIEAQGLIYL